MIIDLRPPTTAPRRGCPYDSAQTTYIEADCPATTLTLAGDPQPTTEYVPGARRIEKVWGASALVVTEKMCPLVSRSEITHDWN